jgi:hypothetical protein
MKKRKSVLFVDKMFGLIMYNFTLFIASPKWSEGLPFIQLIKSRALASGINRTSYKVFFGCKLKVGLSTSFLKYVIRSTSISSEEVLAIALVV